MEILKNDLINLKLNPSLICLLKCIHNKDNEFLIELSKTANINDMVKFLESSMILKKVDDKLSYESFEIRDLKIINYLCNVNVDTVDNDIDKIINYFIKKTGKKRTSFKSASNRRVIKARLSEYVVKDLEDVIDLKYKQWWNDPKMKMYIRIETLFNETKFQGYIGELENSITKDFADDI